MFRRNIVPTVFLLAMLLYCLPAVAEVPWRIGGSRCSSTEECWFACDKGIPTEPSAEQG